MGCAWYRRWRPTWAYVFFSFGAILGLRLLAGLAVAPRLASWASSIRLLLAASESWRSALEVTSNAIQSNLALVCFANALASILGAFILGLLPRGKMVDILLGGFIAVGLDRLVGLVLIYFVARVETLEGALAWVLVCLTYCVVVGLELLPVALGAAEGIFRAPWWPDWPGAWPPRLLMDLVGMTRDPSEDAVSTLGRPDLDPRAVTLPYPV